VAVAAASAAVAVAGCGLGAGKGTSDVTLTVTRDFGTTPIGAVTAKQVPGSETVMRMLERHFPISTRYGGGFVQSIDSRAGDGAQDDWFYYVNGIEAAHGAATTAVHRGDRIWWDLHDWQATDSIPAVVGSFPEPFQHGEGGKRLPTTLECATDVMTACNRVAGELAALGVPAGTQLLGTGSGEDSLGVVVGTWGDIRNEIAASLIEHGPGTSGVYARFAPTGPRAAAAAGTSATAGTETLQLLNPAGQVARTLGAGAGLVAATADSSSTPTWLITGTDAAGVAAAANAFNPGALHDHFALAVQGSADVPVPVLGAG
jgi:hypothetical protein